MFGRIAIALALLHIPAVAWSQPPAKDKIEVLPIPKGVDEVLPVPRAVFPKGNLLLPYPPSYPPQLGTREQWQYYGVDQAGRFRPRVIYAPQGAYYAINGESYPWTTNRPNLYMPYAVD